MYINLLYIKKLSHQAVYVSEGHRLSMFKLFLHTGAVSNIFCRCFRVTSQIYKVSPDLDGISFYSLCSFVRVIINSERFTTVGRLALNFRN